MEVYCNVYRTRESEACEPTMTPFSVSSLLHAGRHECRQQTDFQLPYDIYWLKQHGLVTICLHCTVISPTVNHV